MISQNLEKLKTLTKDLCQDDLTLISFFKKSIDLLAISDLNGTLEKINHAWTKTLGWSEEELTSVSHFEFVHPEDLEATKKVYSLLQNGEEIVYFRNRFRCKDGSYKVLCWTAHPDRKNNMAYIVVRDFSAMMDKLSEQ